MTTMRAEDSFDLTDRLGEIETPTLLVAGERDGFYGTELFRETAEGLARGHLILYPRKGHVGTVASRRLGGEVSAFLAQA
jgi:pimeloyl-ACP methyl ester carboxylesterase